MSNIIEYAPGLAIAMVALGLLVYAFAAAIALFSREWWLREQLRAWFTAAPAQNVGIPSAAISAFAVVAVLLRTFPPTPGVDGPARLQSVRSRIHWAIRANHPLVNVLSEICLCPEALARAVARDARAPAQGQPQKSRR
jgi:hypothetical protein